MPLSILISKIRCKSPNKKGTAVHNRNAIHYMATRSGVDLSSLPDAPPQSSVDTESAMHNKNNIHYMATRSGVDLTPLQDGYSFANTDGNASPTHDKELDTIMHEDEQLAEVPTDVYIKYIHGQTGSHGLFGNIPVDDLSKVEKDVYQIAKKKNIFRGIVSIWEGDAEQLGYYDKGKWIDFIESTLPEVANEFGIPLEKLQWVAAFHKEKSHPHIHYSFWSTGDEVRSPYIPVARQHRCREIFSDKMFEEDRLQAVLNKTMYRDLIIDLGKQAVNSSFDELKKIYVPGVLSNEAPERLSSDQAVSLSGDLIALSKIIPQKGRINYQFMPPEVKTQIDAVTNKLINSPQIKQKYTDFCKAVDNVSKTYSVTKGEKKDRNLKQADDDLKKRLSNIILKATKELAQYKIPLPPQSIPDLPAMEQNYEDEIPDSTSALDTARRTEVTSAPDPAAQTEVTSVPDPAAQTEVASAPDPTKRTEATPIPDPAAQTEVTSVPDSSTQTEVTSAPGPTKRTKATYIPDSAAQTEITSVPDSATQAEVTSVQEAEINLKSGNVEKQSTAIKKLHDLAEKNNAIAQYALGKILISGKYIEKDIDTAIIYLNKAAAQGNNFALYSLGKIYLDIDESHFDFDKAFYCLKKSAENGNQYSSYALGKISLEGTYIPQDVNNAIHYFEMAANQKNSFALYALGKIYEDSQGPFFNLEKAIKCFSQSAEEGNLYAKLHIASMYLFGKNVNKDETLARKLLEPLIAQDFEPAKELLTFYENYKFDQSFVLAQSVFTKCFSAVASSNKNMQDKNYDIQYRSHSKQARKEAYLKTHHDHTND